MMKGPSSVRRSRSGVLVITLALTTALGGCRAHQYRQARRDGQKAMLDGMYGPARYFFDEAERIRPRGVENLHDMAACRVMLARQKFEQMNHAAAMRELDGAVAYYSQAIEVHPGHQASLEGKSVALELKGQFGQALEHAEWAAQFVGPSARQYIFLARELEERGRVDDALLRYRQAVAMEPANFDAHVTLAEFLLRNNSEKAAVHHLRVAYRLNPRDEWVTDQLAARSAIPPLAQPTGEGP